MKLEQDNIYTFKITSGEEIIGRVVSFDDTHVEVMNPIMMAPTQQGLQMIPGMMSINADKSVFIQRGSVTIIGTTRSDIESAYIQATTGLSVPDKKQIIMG
jgi:hypothetical protein